MTLDLDHALTVAREAAAAASAVIRHYWQHGVAEERKSDDTPVTVADREAEAAIRRVLLAAFPDHAIYGEEGGRQGDGAALWLVDPLDGTRSFVRRTPFFSTQIALMLDGELVLGVSCAPIAGETLWARRGGGAWFNGERVAVAATHQLARTSLSIGNVKTLTRGAGWAELGQLIQDVERCRGLGDYCHYHLLARGALDVVVESDVNILDIAALAVIVREAGGVFTDLSGAALDLHTTSVLAAVPALHAPVLARLAGAR
ncbi:MAG TPA: inositol monophosphatase family protein [Rhodanobacteraceae bacterium]|nr:inositol monophosphatase family protein [Rhodanobacteraceae bacterium]